MVSVRMKKLSRTPSPELQQGQVWRMPDANLQIEMVGKQLVHYKLIKTNAKRTPVSLTGKEALQQYLKRNKAILVQE